MLSLIDNATKDEDLKCLGGRHLRHHVCRILSGGTGVRVGRGGRGRRPREGNDEHVDELNGQGNNQGLGANGGIGGSQWECRESQWGRTLGRCDSKWQNRDSCSYKEFLACNPKEYDGKGCAVVLTCWIEKMENVQDMSGCSNDQKVKYIAGSFVVAKVRNLVVESRHVGAGPCCVFMIGNNVADLFMKVEKRGNVGEPSKDKNGRDDNKRIRTVNAFATTLNPNFLNLELQ
ncbi:hypothetical protein Tco_0980111 [Tanacetum coccineum]